MEKILTYNLKDTAKIKRAADAMHIRVEEIAPCGLRQSVGSLAEGKKAALVAPFEGTVPTESLLVFCNISGKHMDRLLFTFRQMQITVDYKAVLTPTNQNWTVLMLLVELGREKNLLK